MASADKGDKRMSIERIYQKKTQLEHILLRPDTYIGSSESYSQTMWVYDEGIGFNYREISYVPGLYKIFDEILVNAADNRQRDPNMKRIKIDIVPEENKITIMNDGKGIPVEMHKEHDMYVPTLIFGHLLTSSNFDDEQKKVTGGRNGFGAKLCNVFSTSFQVETSNKSSGKYFKQEWRDNMSKVGKASVGAAKAQDFTRVTFSPDLSKFNMTALDRDTVALMKRRAYDIAAVCNGVSVTLNGEKLPVKNFKDYADMYIKASMKDEADEENKKVTLVYDKVGTRWEVGLGSSQNGFQQISFVNSIATTKGGTHVEYISKQIVDKVIEACKKKIPKGGVEIKPAQVKQHLFLFINASIENPAFDSQTKENMTLKKQKFGSTCELPDKFMKEMLKLGIVDFVMDWANTKSQRQTIRRTSEAIHSLNKKFQHDTGGEHLDAASIQTFSPCGVTLRYPELQQKSAGKKSSRVTGLPKLNDANDAGTARSKDCVLILTEGDSAKGLAMSGRGVVGSDKYGVFPLKGKLLNVREANHKQIVDNAEINSIVKIVGLKYGKKYLTDADMATLRYGKIMIMADQDVDGSHIKGLLINFIHHNWPSLIKQNFLLQFITPIIKASKGKEVHCFYSLPEFKEWKDACTNVKSWKLKYYKGLGTSTSDEAKEYFSDMARHRIRFRYQGDEDDKKIVMAFSKKAVDDRKTWLVEGMQERKDRRARGESELYLYNKTQTTISYKEFVDRELILFSNYDNERSIPSLVDGFKPGQRKILFTCFKRKQTKEIKVAQLTGSVSELAAYHHGEMSLYTTVVNLAQNYCGANNLNLLEPNGQFGTRVSGGSDAASARYIFTCLSPLTRLVFPPIDDFILAPQWDDNMKIEPFWYCPIIPMVLVNGAQGIGTGFSTYLPNFSVQDIIKNIRGLIKGEEYREMVPSFRKFTGGMVQMEHDPQRFYCYGKVHRTADNRFMITELPIGTWTQNYVEKVMLPFVEGNEKVKPIITEYSEQNTDETVKFICQANPGDITKWEHEGIHQKFKLITTISLTNMVLHDKDGILKKYESPAEIMKEFYAVRIEMYKKRKAYMLGKLQAEGDQLSNKARFILEVSEKKITIVNVKHKDQIAQLIQRGYDKDPVKVWQTDYDRMLNTNPEDVEVEDDQANDSQEDDGVVTRPGDDMFNYLIDMAIKTLHQERKDALLKKRDEKMVEIEELRKLSLSEMWINDLDALEAGLVKYEANAKAKSEQANNRIKSKKKGPAKKIYKYDTQDPGEEMDVKLPKETVKTKREPKSPKEPKVKKEPKIKRDPGQPDIRDSMGSNHDGENPPTLAQRLAARSKKGGKPSPKKKKPWETDSEASGDFISDPSDPSGSDGGFSDDDQPSKSSNPTNGAKAKLKPVKEEVQSDDSDIQEVAPAKPAPVKRKLGPITNADKPTAKKQTTLSFGKKEQDAFDLSDDDVPIVKRTAVKSKPAPANKAPATKKAPLKKRKSWQSDESSEDEKPKKGRMKIMDSDSENDFDMDNTAKSSPVIPNYSSRGAAKKPVKYNFSDSESD